MPERYESAESRDCNMLSPPRSCARELGGQASSLMAASDGAKKYPRVVGVTNAGSLSSAHPLAGPPSSASGPTPRAGKSAFSSHCCWTCSNCSAMLAW